MDVYDYGYLHFNNTIIRPEVKRLENNNDFENRFLLTPKFISKEVLFPAMLITTTKATMF